MTWLPDPSFRDTHFAPAKVAIRHTRWEDWPLLDALYATPGGWQVKNYYFGQFGRAGFEGEYLWLRQDMDRGAVLDAKVMHTPEGAIVGHAMLGVQKAWRERPLVLDCMAHANFHDQVPQLLAAIDLPPDRKVQAFCDQGAGHKIAALGELGFQQEGVFAKQAQDEDGAPLDVIVFGRLP